MGGETGERARVGLISAGGTIEAVGESRLDQAWYSESGARAEAGHLLAMVPEIKNLADVEPIPFPRVTPAATSRELLELSRTVQAALARDDVDGMVITHGTNAIEETAFLLDLVLAGAKPVVLVGAMRPSSALGADGYLNLYRGIQVASAPTAADKGVMVVMNDTIYAARDVTKTSTFRVQALQGRDLGPLGFADADDSVVFYHEHVRRRDSRPRFDVSDLEVLPRVDIVVSYVDADGMLIDAAVAAGARGIVSAGRGSGRPTQAEEEALARAAGNGVIVCQASRVGSGRVPRSPGRRELGIVAADNLVPWKARILLALALTRTTDPDDIQELFDRA